MTSGGWEVSGAVHAVVIGELKWAAEARVGATEMFHVKRCRLRTAPFS